MLENKDLTYISLFSSSGVGCYGIKMAGFQCIATNELIERRLNIQKINNKCSKPSGYILGDITQDETKGLIFDEITKWKKDGNDRVDVVVATPPCQGMSVANHKKSDDEIIRNSLVVESIKLINDIKPRFFILENVSSFWKTGCTAPNGEIKEIGQVITEELGTNYTIMNRIINFKNYGSNSSRTRTVVIGVDIRLSEYISPIELYPKYRKEKKLADLIGNYPKLEWGEFSENDFYHQFRTYPEYMKDWIQDLKEGESAFDNIDHLKRPYKLVNGERVANKRKNGDKYTRQYWNKVAPCIHTRNDQLASQNTVHPEENRVFSIRELMTLMTIPKDFRWINMDERKLNSLSFEEKKRLLKKEEINIRQSIGEAVPTQIFYEIGSNIKKFMNKRSLGTKEIKDIIKNFDLFDRDNLKKFILENKLNLGYSSLCRIAELTNSNREENSAFFTNKFIINEILKSLPDFEKERINIIEPSVGVGNFLPLLFIKYEHIKKVNIDVVDIDYEILEILRLLLAKIEVPKNVVINFINKDYLLLNEKKYDLTIGNPPFTKLSPKECKKYLHNNINKDTTNIFEFFLEKAIRESDYIAMITPKSLLNTPEFKETREYISNYKVECINDFGEKGFKGVLVETICIFINTLKKKGITKVKSFTLNIELEQNQGYIFDKNLPYWVIYRNDNFDNIFNKMEFDIFTCFRDRQITNSNTIGKKDDGYIRVIKSRNISDDGTEIINKDNYDSYIKLDILKELSVYKYFNNNNIYLTPNMTYKPRVRRMVPNTIVNGSVAILIPRKNIVLTEEEMKYFSTEEYREFYRIARNYQTRSLNIDSASCYWFGKF